MKNRLLKTGLLTLSILAMGVFSLARGTGDSAGGNAIRCDDGKLYSWDYINAPMEKTPVDPTLLKAKSAKEILEILESRLAKVRPKMAKSLNDFRKFNEDLLDE